MEKTLIESALKKIHIFQYFWNDRIFEFFMQNTELDFEPSEYVGVFKKDFTIPLHLNDLYLSESGLKELSAIMNVRFVSLTESFSIADAINNIDLSSPSQSIYITVVFTKNQNKKAFVSFNLGSEANSIVKADSDFIQQYSFLF